ncbi:MAG: hypothetical protein ACREFB_17925 [Stellaceae bacterium]
MPRCALVLLLGLAACASSDTAPASGPVSMADWRMASGEMPTRAEFSAVVASCQDRGGALAPCLADLGLHRTR